MTVKSFKAIYQEEATLLLQEAEANRQQEAAEDVTEFIDDDEVEDTTRGDDPEEDIEVEIEDTGLPAFNWNLPNFEALDHIPYLIRFLGAPKLYSTLVSEAFHQAMKSIVQGLNGKNVERDSVIQVIML